MNNTILVNLQGCIGCWTCSMGYKETAVAMFIVEQLEVMLAMARKLDGVGRRGCLR